METWLGWLGRPARIGLTLTLMAAAAGSLGGSAGAQAKPPAAQTPGQLKCVNVATEASFASVGYDHLVHVTNNCKRAVSCSVKTNVNPDPASVQLAPGETRTLTTWRGSPAREFTADAKCLEQ